MNPSEAMSLSFQYKRTLKVYSHLRFIRSELLREIFNHKNWIHNPLSNFSVHANVDQIASVNASTWYSKPLFSKQFTQ